MCIRDRCISDRTEGTPGRAPPRPGGAFPSWAPGSPLGRLSPNTVAPRAPTPRAGPLQAAREHDRRHCWLSGWRGSQARVAASRRPAGTEACPE
eukprot:3754518-Rhodomonas_salina.2